MPEDFKRYLATEIFSEQRTISYRNVARTLKVHVNAAKCMLYEFHQCENRKKPGSVYATYLLCGKKRLRPNPPTNGHSNGVVDDDEPMPSSPPPFTSSMLEPSEHGSQQGQTHSPNVSVKTIKLVREESLDEVQEQFEVITSIHIYSLSPHRIQDLVTLTDISRGLYTDVFVKEDPLIHNKLYGVIQNPEVRRRKGKRPLIPEAPASKFKAVKDEPKPSVVAQAPSQLEAVNKEEPARPGSSGSTTSATSVPKPAKLKRDDSDIFKAFHKAKGKPKLERNDTDASTNASASGTEDAKMTDADEEDESEEEAVFLDTGTSKPATKKRPSDVKKERDDKAAKLRKMMDSDDEAEMALPNVEDATGLKTDRISSKPGGAGGEDGQDADDVAWSDSDTEMQRQSAPGKDTSTNHRTDSQVNVESHRRRGRRQVMKKRTAKDEDGYLVTKEEAVWESYSEEEKEPKRSISSFPAKTQASQAPKSSAASGKAGGVVKKGGGGNIMNFFGKK